jgi:polysaccharide biosynthesis/export protein
MRRILPATLLSLLLLAVYSPASMAQSPAGTPPAGYRLQKEDVIRISVRGEPDLSAEVVVDPSGQIFMPQVGLITAEGLTQEDLADRISLGLKKILVSPKVQLQLVQFRKPKVYVLGHVNRPGPFDFKPGDKVMEAIAQAGSFAENADLSAAKLTRAGADTQIPIDLDKLFYKGDLSQNLDLKDGDTIYIPEGTTQRYFVMGEVMRQGQYPLKKSFTVMDAISNAGGPTERASLKNTYVLRGDLANPQRIKVDLQKFTKKADMSQNIELQPGDVVMVSETSKPNWDKIARVLSSVVSTSYLFRIWGL